LGLLLPVALLLVGSPILAETCDGFDNDGNGVIDDDCDVTCDDPRISQTEVRLTTAPGNSTQADVVWTGAEFGVAWVDERSGSPEICFARLDRDGEKVADETCHPAGSPAGVAIAWSETGEFYAVMYADQVDQTLRVHAYHDGWWYPGTLSQGVKAITSGSVIWAAGRFAVVWQSITDEIILGEVSGASHQLAVGDAVRADESPSNASLPALAYGKVNPTTPGYGVVWHDTRETPSQIYFSGVYRVGGGLYKTGPDMPISPVTGTFGVGRATIAWTGTQFGVAWDADINSGSQHWPRIYFAALEVDGSIAIPPRRVADGTARFPSLAWTGGEYIVAWNSDYVISPGSTSIHVQRIDSAGNNVGPTVQWGNSYRSSLAWSGTDPLLVYESVRGSDSEIYARKLSCCDDVDLDGFTECDGDPNDLDPASFPGAIEVCDGRDNNGDGVLDETCDSTCDAPGRGFETPISGEDAGDEWNGFGVAGPRAPIAWTGSDFGIAWYGGPDQWSRRGTFRLFDSSGQPISNETALELDSRPSAMAWTGREFGIADSSGSFYRFDDAGNLLGTTQLPISESILSVVWTGGEYGAASGRDFIRIDRLGNPIGSPLRFTSLAYESHLAWNGREYAVVYSASSGTYFRRISAGGTLVGDAMTIEVGSAHYPQIVWNGEGYGIAWLGADDLVRFCTVDESGNIVTPVLPDSFARGPISLVWTGEEYAFFWQGNFGEIWGQRLDAFANPLPPSAIVGQPPWGLYPYQINDTPMALWTGTEYAVTFAHHDFFENEPPESQGSWETFLNKWRCCGNDIDGDGSGSCEDCDDSNPDRYPGNLEVCDNIDNDCDEVVDGLVTFCGVGECVATGSCNAGVDNCTPGSPLPEVCDALDNDCDGTVDGFATSCGLGQCAAVGMCQGGADNCVPADPSPEACDGLDNDCDGAVPVDESDGDSDGYRLCDGDCNDADGSVYPGAGEVNDGLDNQCPGDSGYGIVDELSDDIEPGPPGKLCWTPQPGATQYEIARSEAPDFGSCFSKIIGTTCWHEPQDPASREGYYYLVRPVAPFVGSWGKDRFGVELTLTCGAQCAHSSCETGSALDPTCDACVEQICAVDSNCCDRFWDPLCIEQVRTVCESLVCEESMGSCAHPLCTGGEAVGAGCDAPPATPSCVDLVCLADEYCCTTAWDSICVGEVASVCEMNCSGIEPICSDGEDNDADALVDCDDPDCAGVAGC